MAFPIGLQRSLWPILILFGVRRGAASVHLDGDRLVARFGYFRASTPLANVTRWDITGPYHWWRAAGVRTSPGKPELTFGGNARGGVCLHLRERIAIAGLSIEELYLTVDDLEGLGAALSAHGIPGEDLRAAAR